MTKKGLTYWLIALFCGFFPALAAFVFAANHDMPPIVCGGAVWAMGAVFCFGWLCIMCAAGREDERCGRK